MCLALITLSTGSKHLTLVLYLQVKSLLGSFMQEWQDVGLGIDFYFIWILKAGSSTTNKKTSNSKGEVMQNCRSVYYGVYVGFLEYLSWMFLDQLETEWLSAWSALTCSAVLKLPKIQSSSDRWMQHVSVARFQWQHSLVWMVLLTTSLKCLLLI